MKPLTRVVLINIVFSAFIWVFGALEIYNIGIMLRNNTPFLDFRWSLVYWDFIYNIPMGGSWGIGGWDLSLFVLIMLVIVNSYVIYFNKTRYCPQCGSDVAMKARFCSNCGKQL